MTTAEIVRSYMLRRGGGEKPLTFRAFADELNETITPYGDINHATIHTWVNGVQPNYWLLVYLWRFSDTWAGDMAADLLAVIKPEVFGVPDEVVQA